MMKVLTNCSKHFMMMEVSTTGRERESSRKLNNHKVRSNENVVIMACMVLKGRNRCALH